MDSLHLRRNAAPDLDGLVARLAVRRHLHEHADLGAATAAAQRQVERAGERGRLLDVRVGSDDGPVVGEVWLVTEGEELAMADVRLDDVTLAPTLRGLVAGRARSEGAVRLTATVSAGDPVGAAFVAGGGFELGSTQLRLDLAADLPSEDVVVLEPMDATTYERWRRHKEIAYVEERTLSGESPRRAQEVAREQHARLLPDGFETEHHSFFVARDGGVRVGTVWIGTERPAAFVYDVEIDEPHRRRGLGAGAMRASALWARDLGSHELGLNVFGHNRGARALYDRLGYAPAEEFWGMPL